MRFAPRAWTCILAIATALITLAPLASADEPQLGVEGFLENCGQLAPEVRFEARMAGMRALFESDAMTLALRTGGTEFVATEVRWVPVGADASVAVRGVGHRPGVINIYRGRERFEGLSLSESLLYEGIYPGIDLKVGLDEAGLKSDWIVSPGADWRTIGWRLEGATRTWVEEGSLHIDTPLGLLTENPPLVYQEGPGGREVIAAEYRIEGDIIGFEIGQYDRSRALVIDPVIEWSTYLGGRSGDYGHEVVIDAAGNVIVAGDTVEFPVTPGAYQTSPLGWDCFIAKLDSSGQLLFATYLGGFQYEWTKDLAVLPTGEILIFGDTKSSDFPITPGVFDTTYGSPQDSFISKLDGSLGTLLRSTYLGGSDLELGAGMEVDASGNIYCAGVTESPDFPTTPGAYQQTRPGKQDGYVIKLDPTMSTALFSTYLGSPERENLFAIAVDSNGEAIVAGLPGDTFGATPGAFDSVYGYRKAFVARLSADGSQRLRSTFLGGTTSTDGFTFVTDLAIDRSGQILAAGTTPHADHPVTAGAYDTTYAGGSSPPDGFITQLDPTLSRLGFSTYLGRERSDLLEEIAVDPTSGAIAFASTWEMRTFFEPYEQIHVGLLDESGSNLIEETITGGTQRDRAQAVAFDANGHYTIVGTTNSINFPTTEQAYDRTLSGSDDAFVMRIAPRPFVHLVGKPAASETVHFAVEHLHASQIGLTALVFLSGSGTQGIPLPGGQQLPLTFDVWTQLSMQLPFLSGTVDASRRAQTPPVTLPASIPTGLTLWAAALTYDLNTNPKVKTVTGEHRFMTQ